MNSKKILGIAIELLLIVAVSLIGWKVYAGSPLEASYGNDVLIPFTFVYIGLYALKIFLVKNQSNSKYLFYLTFGILALGLRFYEEVELTDSIKNIALGAVGVLMIYHIVEIIKEARRKAE